MALVAIRRAPFPIQPGRIDVPVGEWVAFVVVVGPVPGQCIVDLELQVVMHDTPQPEADAMVAGSGGVLGHGQVADAVVAVRTQAG